MLRFMNQGVHAPFRACKRALSVGIHRPIRKVMAANRGEIAIRIFRSAHELGLKTVAIYSEQDIHALHRQKSTESYMVGLGLSPLDAYLCIPDIIRIAKENDVDAIHPGYGFMSERADFAQAVVDAGIHWIGPEPKVVAMVGDKSAARALAIRCGVPVVPGTEHPIEKWSEVEDFVDKVGLPVILKATFGGGGRGVRVVRERAELKEAFERATSEAKAAFGNGSMYIEKFVEQPRHLEVQIMGDSTGEVVHFFERDCSVQRRHQKVVEVAPSPNLDPELRQKILDAALKVTRECGYTNAGTVEFLVKGKDFYFMEINARLQVEHTVTEEITSLDLVNTQIQIANGKTLKDLHMTQDRITQNCHAIQCRITTEDPLANFRPDIGRIIDYVPGGGAGIRFDGATVYAGASVSPHYDSLLLKVTAKGHDHKMAAARAYRLLDETVIGPVKTNIPFLKNVMKHPDFLAGGYDTTFLEKPELFVFPSVDNPKTQLMQFVATQVVNGVLTPLGTSLPPSNITPVCPPVPPRKEWYQPMNLREIYKQKGPKAFAKAVRDQRKADRPWIMDTTYRDAHQSLLATRFRTIDMANCAPYASYALRNAYSLEMWGGATFDCALQFLHECPWDRLSELRRLIPNIPFQMLLRGANIIGYSGYADNVVRKFCEMSVQYGIDIFRVFDSLNYMPNLLAGCEAVNRAGGIVEATICYTGDLASPKEKKYTLEYFINLAEQLVNNGAHVLCIKDMAGILKPEAARILFSALRTHFPEVPLHLHTHDTAGNGVATEMEAIKAGADIVDVCVDAVSGMTSQPSLGALVAALEHTKYQLAVNPRDVSAYNDYWEQARCLYAPFECTVTMKSGTADVYQHQIPGGQYTNLQFQAFSLGLSSQFPQVKKAYTLANKMLGDVIKVTPSSKVVGDLAQFMVQNKLMDEKTLLAKADSLSFPSSVVDFFQGGLGQPYGGFPEPLATKVLKGKPRITKRPGDSLPPADFKAIEKRLKEMFPSLTIRECDVMSYAVFPKETNEFLSFKEKYGPVDKLPTNCYLGIPPIGSEWTVKFSRGDDTHYKLSSLGPIMKGGITQEVFFEVNGMPRRVVVENTKVMAHEILRKKADRTLREHLGAPMPGKVIGVKVKEGQTVRKNEAVCVLSAMKMETLVTVPFNCTIKTLHIKLNDDVSAGDLLMELVPAEKAN
eukprot:TRINITY_DN1647_c0_g1_i1.p1 TRINITY_DN1647_c0_g1~~TRINITY_DN1647_c0_g1_i1.p1  ORF type:complete len:1183 (-),score=308.47 TRINITY_DN1647_c0_g1_i1:109-3657(-)